MKIKERKKESKEEDIVELLKPLTTNLKKISKAWLVFGIILIILILLIGITLYYAGNAKNFTYNGLNFNITYFGKVKFYTANIPIVDQQGKFLNYASFDFRIDPRTLKDIPLEKYGDISFINSNTVYLTYDSNISPCENNTLAAANLGQFFASFGFQIRGAVNDPTYNNSEKYTFANCTSNPDSTVLYIHNGNETRIFQSLKNCYEIISKDCEILRATEKFQLQFLEESTSKISLKS